MPSETMHTETYCETLDTLDKVEAIRAIHAAYIQLLSVTKNCDVQPFDNGPALRQLHDCLALAGHPGFKTGDYSSIQEGVGAS